MPITDIDHRARTLGRIRAGEFDDDTGRPTSGTTWRLTSPHRHLLDHAEAIYGGHVEALDRKDTDDRFQLTTNSDTLDVIIPPQDVAAGQWWEAYTAAGLQARCDGNVVIDGAYFRNHDTDQHPPACVCTNLDKRRCKPTTRINFILPDLPDVGVWRLTTRSIYAAAEMPTQIDFLFRRAQYPNAILALEERSTKTGDGVHRFTVPIIRIEDTLISILAGDGSSQATAGALGGGDTPPPIDPGSLAPDDDARVPPPQIPPPEASKPPPPTDPEASEADTHETTPTPLERNLGALASYLDDNHPYQLPNAPAILKFCTDLFTLGESTGIWQGQTLDSLATARIKAFRGGPADALDVAGDTFTARAEAVDLPELRTFATRLWMEAQTFVDTKGRTHHFDTQ